VERTSTHTVPDAGKVARLGLNEVLDEHHERVARSLDARPVVHFLLHSRTASYQLKAKFHYTGPTGPDRTRTDPRGLFRETRAADPGLRQSPRILSGRVRSGPCSGPCSGI